MQTATNPQTGEKVQWDGTGWKPAGGAPQQASPTIYRTPPKPLAPQRPEDARGTVLTNAQKEADLGIVPYKTRTAAATATKAEADAAAAIAKAEAAAGIKTEPVRQAAITELQSVLSKIDELELDAKDNDGWFETGASGSLARKFGPEGTAAFDLAENVKTVDANSAFTSLQAMRDASPTGGALGQITEKELDLLKAKVANLNPNQSQETFLANLQDARDFYNNMLKKVGGEPKGLTADIPGTPETGPPGQRVEQNGVITGFYDQDGKFVPIDTGPNFDAEGNPIPADQLNRGAERQRQAMLNERADQQEALTGEAGMGTRIASGATLGFNDEISGIVGGVAGLFNGEGVVQGYENARDTKRIINERAGQRTGLSGDVAEIGGGLLIPGVGIAKAGGAIRQGMKAGAIGGALAGAGYGEGVDGTVKGATIGGVGGAALGAAIPGLVGAARPTANAFSRITGRDKNVAVNQVRNALTADGNTPLSASKAISAAQSRKSPMAIADTGENSRQLLASVSRQPGAARRIGVETTSKRQEEQLERISSAVRRDLGPTANIRELGEALIDKARKNSRPIYEKFENNSGAGALYPKIQGLLERPSMQKALKNAEKTMKEEGVDPKSLGFDLDGQGEVILTKVPSFKALDYIKRGADDVIEKYRDSTTGRLVLDGQGRAANNTLRAFVARIDKANPDYAAARGAYAGPAKMKSALEKGAKGLRKSPDDIMAEMKNLSPSEKEMYRNGVRKGIVDLLEGKGDYADKVNALIGTEKSRKTLTRVFGGKSGLDRFIKTLRDEREIGLTYKAVNTGSPTALRMNFDSGTSEDRILSSAIDIADSANRSGVVGAVRNAIGKVREAGTLGAGKAGDDARESIAALLSETDPAELDLIIKSARRLAAKQRLLKRKQIRNAGRQGNAAGRGSVISTEDSRP